MKSTSPSRLNSLNPRHGGPGGNSKTALFEFSSFNKSTDGLFQYPVKDLLSLAKPMITLMSLLMAAAGLALAPGSISSARILLTLLGTALVVASAHALNMVWERETDRLMERTRCRPLPAGRMAPFTAWAFGGALGVMGTATLFLGSNPLTAALGAAALLIYVLAYTPLKQVSPAALFVGAISGAMPPLMGWTAVTGRMDAPGLTLYAIMLVWQIPHFLSIALFRKAEYAAAGIRTVPVVYGDTVARLQSLAFSTLLLPISLLFVPMGLAGRVYFVAVLALGFGFLAVNLAAFLPGDERRRARNLFRASLVYLPVLTAVLVLDVHLP